MKIDKPGTFFDFDTADYFADPCPVPSLTQSVAKTIIEKSPRHAMLEHPRLAPLSDGDDEAEKYVKAQAIGNAAHEMLLGRGKQVAVLDFDAFRSKEAKQSRDEAAAAGKVPILAKHFEQAEAMVEAARPQIAAISGCEAAFIDGRAEVVVANCEGETWLRSMIDWMETPRRLWDLKTTGMVAAPWGIGRMMVDAGWDVQAAMQERILDVLDPDGAGRRTFRFVCVENEPPFAATVSELTESVMTMGRKKLTYAIDLWQRCMASGDWPAYPAEIILPEYPGFKETLWLNREVQEYERAERRGAKREPMLTTLMGG